MAKIDIQLNKSFLKNKYEELDGLSGGGWLDFFEAVGRIESGNRYDVKTAWAIAGSISMEPPLLRRSTFSTVSERCWGFQTSHSFKRTP
jgi:hypothetical protein